MGFLDSFGGGHGKNIPPGATFRLTEQGREKLQEFSGDPKGRILVALETRGTSDVDDITAAAGLNRGQVERMIPQMVRGGYIQYASRATDED